jgi:uncharacterized phage infection (PIP) family protein YhgE
LKIFLQIILIAVIVTGGLYLGKMMQEAVGYMKAMNAHTIKMSKTIDSMATDIDSMSQQFKGMHDGISDINRHIALMSSDTQNMASQLAGMNAGSGEISGLAGLEHHIAKLNADMSSIQRSMSADLKGMRQGVDSMSYDVRYMRDSLVQMSADIHRGSEAFSSPPDYFRNMFNYGR